LMFRAIEEIAVFAALMMLELISESWLRWFISFCISNMSATEIDYPCC
jgi:hypothetical protein